MNNSNRWIFNNGQQTTEWTTFPYAFREMFFAFKTGLKQKKNPIDMGKQFSIKSPLGKRYSYSEATELAESQGLLSPDGQLNNKEFKKK